MSVTRDSRYVRAARFSTCSTMTIPGMSRIFATVPVLIMRVHLICFELLLWGGALVRALHGQQPAPAADEVVATMLMRDGAREAASGGYTGSREYILENHRLNKRAEMVVTITCDRNGEKHFLLISEDGWKSANKHVLH